MNVKGSLEWHLNKCLSSGVFQGVWLSEKYPVTINKFMVGKDKDKNSKLEVNKLKNVKLVNKD